MPTRYADTIRDLLRDPRALVQVRTHRTNDGRRLYRGQVKTRGVTLYGHGHPVDGELGQAYANALRSLERRVRDELTVETAAVREGQR